MTETRENQEFDYDDLDELLEEDPSKLEHVESKVELSDMVEDLRKEFEELNKNEDNDDAKEGLEKLLHMVEEQTKESSSDGDSFKEGSSNNFQDLMNDAFQKLKQNGSNVDSDLKKKQANGEDLLNHLLEEFMEEQASDNKKTNPNEDGLDGTILNILNKMSSKEVLYEPMKQMHQEYTEWFNTHEQLPQHQEKMAIYKKQYGIVTDIVTIYERDDYSNDKYLEEITKQLDSLEQLGDTPLDKDPVANPQQQQPELADTQLKQLQTQIDEGCKQQ